MVKSRAVLLRRITTLLLLAGVAAAVGAQAAGWPLLASPRWRIWQAAVSPGGTYLAVVSVPDPGQPFSPTFQVIDLARSTVVFERLGMAPAQGGFPPPSVAFSPDGSSFILAEPDGGIAEYSLPLGARTATWRGPSELPASQVRFVEGGRRVVAMVGQQVLGFSRDGSSAALLSSTSRWVIPLSSSGDGEWIALADEKQVQFLHVRTGARRVLANPLKATPHALALSRGAETALVTAETGGAILRREGEPAVTLRPDLGSRGAVADQDGGFLIPVGMGVGIRAVDGSSVGFLRAPVSIDYAYNIASSPGGETVAVAGFDGPVVVFDRRTGAARAITNDYYSLVAATNGGGFLLASPGNGPFRWVSPAGDRSLDASSYRGAAADSQGRFAVVPSPSGGIVWVFNLASPSAPPREAPSAGYSRGRGIALNHDASVAAITSTNPSSLIFLEPATGKQIARAPGEYQAVAFDRTGTRLAAVGATVDLYDAPRWQKTAEIKIGRPGVIHAAVAFSADGRRLFVGGTGGVVHVWDLATRTLAATLTAPAGAGHVEVLAVDPGGVLLAGGGRWGTMVWKLAEGKVAAVVPNPSIHFQFVADGAVIAMDHPLGTVAFYEVASGRMAWGMATTASGSIWPPESVTGDSPLAKVARSWIALVGQGVK